LNITWYSEAKQIVKLALPLLFTQIIAALMFFTDTVVASKAGYIEMASVSVATGIWYPVIFTAQGLLIAVTPVVAQMFGADREQTKSKQMTSNIFQGGYLALILTSFVIVLYQFVDIPINALELEPQLESKSLQYLDYVVLGILPATLFFVLRGFCEGVNQTKPALIVSVIALIANIPLNFIFVFGLFGAPELGGAGCGLATALVQWISLISLLIYFKVSKKLARFNLFQSFELPKLSAITGLIKVGTPIAFSVFFETTLFACMALFIAPLGALSVAGHQVAYSYSAVIFMLPLSLSMATTIRVGTLRGAEEFERLTVTIKTALVMAFMFGVVVMLTTILFRHDIIGLYTDNADVVAIAASILVVTAIYQIPDAIQVMSGGIFKGLKITKPLFYITFVSYWPIGFTLGYIIARTDWILPALGAKGFWVGVVIGLCTASVLFLYKLRNIIIGFNKSFS
jgi:MATE family multidrug resistance protein